MVWKTSVLAALVVLAVSTGLLAWRAYHPAHNAEARYTNCILRAMAVGTANPTTIDERLAEKYGLGKPVASYARLCH